MARTGGEGQARLANGAVAPATPVDPWNAAIEGGEPLELASYPGALLLRVANAIHQETTAVYARRHRLSVPEWRILGRLYISAPIKMAALCRVSFIDKGQVSRVLGHLTERGLAEMRPDPAHRHRRIVDISPAGRALAERVFPEALAEQLSLLRVLTAEERRVTYSVLRKLLAIYGMEVPPPRAVEETDE